jgi:hypothetical protein
MADPRNAVAFEGIGEEVATYLIDNSTITYDITKAGGSAQVGLAVTLSGDGTVALTADSDAVEGKLLLVESDNKASVQVEGYVKLPGGASATLTRGTKIVGALGASSARGYIRSAAAGTAAELIKCRGRIVDVSDTTNVVVDL